MQTHHYPALPEHVRAEILRRLTPIELLVICERFGARQIAARLGVNLVDAIQQAANNNKQ